MTDQRKRLGTTIDNHILATGEEYRAFAKRAEVSVETLAKARRGEKINDRSLRRIENALGWPPGTAETILAGGAPPTSTEPPRVPRDTRPPVEADDPRVRLEGTPPLEPHELLEGWPIDGGRTHYHYRDSRDADAPLDIRMIMGSSTPLEDVVKRMRAMTGIGRM